MCYICGEKAEAFERITESGGGFKQHIKVDHYMWNYVFYLGYLKEKDPLDYNGIESFIWESVEK